MARERGFTDEQIIAAADQLAAAGKNINGSSLRAIIGVGRPKNLIDTYENLMKNGVIQVKNEVVDTAQEMVHQELPPEIADMRSVVLGDVDSMINRINDLAHHTVEQRLNGAIKEANKRAADAAIREAESVKEQEKAFDQVEDVLDTVDAVNKEKEILNNLKTQLKSSLDISLSETKSAEKTITERDQRIGAAGKQLNEAQKQLKDAETSLARADGRVDAITGSLEAKTAEYKDLRLEFSTLQNGFNAISVSEAELRTNNQHKSTEINEQRQQLDALRANEVALGDDLEELRIVNTDLVATNKQLLAEIEQLKTANKGVVK
jgi:chromosome segregation ATPase